MINKLYFKPSYSVEPIEPDQIFLLSEREAVCLSDRFSCRVAFLLRDGHKSVDEIIDIIQLELLQEQKYSQETADFFQSVLDVTIKAQHAMFQMEQQGYLVEEDDSLRSHLAIFCHHLNITPAVAARRLQSTKVTVKANFGLATEDFIAILKSLDIQVADAGDFTVFLSDDYLDTQLNKFNQQALKSESPWMLVNPLGTIIWIGPIFHPNKTGCWECLAHRLRDNKPIESFIQRHKQISLSPPLGFLASTMQTALGMAATEVFKWIVQGENPRLEGTLVTYDTLNLQNQDHILVKRPQCPSCKQIVNGLENKPLPVVLEHRKKSFITDGGHRYCSPQETIRKYQHHISPITGVVRELSKIPGNGLTHTYVAKHHFKSIFDDLNSLLQNNCYYGYPQSDQPDCWADSNGCAAGNTLEEAILQGFMELVERDCVAMWWYNHLQKPQVDLDSFNEPYFLRLKQYYQSIERELWVLDLTNDFNIPTFAAITRRMNREVEDIILGYGTHFDAKIALGRALTEVNQILPNLLFAKDDGSTQYPASGDRLAINWWKTATLVNQPYLVPNDKIAAKVYADYPQIFNDDLLEDIKLCQQLVEKNGLEMLVLDQTRPDIGLRVAKVIVPGMRHMWKRLAPGRLYDMPVKMGWLSDPLTEEQLNSFPMWM